MCGLFVCACVCAWAHLFELVLDKKKNGLHLAFE